MRTLSDWFDTHNKDHLRAYKHLSETGHWPEFFLPSEAEVVIGPMDVINIQAKMAATFIWYISDELEELGKFISHP